MSYNVFGLVAVMILTLGIGYALATSRLNPFPVRIVLAGLLLRVVGSTVRYDMIRIYYGGLADAQRYFNAGRDIARRAWSGEPVLFDLEFWFGGPRWWGTGFVEKITGLVVTLIGPTMRGTYLVYSLFSFTGLYLIALAAHRQRPGPGAARFATWIWLWPALWFWPSSIGKESITVLAMGLVFFGYVGRRDSISWIPFLGGLALAFALRPHVGAALALATMAAYWFQSWSRFGPRRIFESVVAVVLAVFLLTQMAGQFGLDADLEGAQEFVTYRSGQTMEGGSQISGAPSGLATIPMAFVNIWMRPFPWDVHNLMAAFAAAEIGFLLAYAIGRRRSLMLSLRHWRRDRMLAFALPMVAGYTLMIGMTFANLGIIARQRSPLFPFVFLLLSAAGTYAAAKRRRGTERPAWGPPPNIGPASRPRPESASAARRRRPGTTVRRPLPGGPER